MLTISRLPARVIHGLASAAAGVLIACTTVPAQAAPVTIDFSDQTASFAIPVANPLIYPEASFSSSNGLRVFSFAGSFPLDKGLCPNGAVACNGALSVSFAAPISNLSFDVFQVDERDSILNITGMTAVGAFSRQISLVKGWNVNSIALTDLQGLTQITLDGTGDEEGVIFDNFRFEAAAGAGSAVPEPGAWALMIVGFSGLGLALRKRRRQGFATA